MTHSRFQRKICHVVVLGGLLMSLLFQTNYSAAATLHAIIVADTIDPTLHADQDRDNFQQLVHNVSEATALELNTIVIDKMPDFGYDTVRQAMAELSVTAKNDVVIFYFSGRGYNTDTSTRWPALDVTGKGTAGKNPDRTGLLELNWVKDTLQQKSPQLLLVVADTGNEFLSDSASYGGKNIILGEVKKYQQAYRKLFLGYQGTIVAAGAGPEQNAYRDEEGGRFTQTFLNSLQKELEGSDPDWQRIQTATEESMGQATGPKQSPQMAVEVKEIALADGGNLLPGLGHNNQSLPPTCVMEAESSSRAGCYWNLGSDEGGSKWNVFLEDKLWLNRWHGWTFNNSGSPGSTGHYVAATSKEEMVHLITLGARYEKISARLTVSPEHAYGFPLVSDLYYFEQKDIREWRTDNSAEREEFDITLGYSILPELQVGLGFKKITQAYYIVEGKEFTVGEQSSPEDKPLKNYKYADYKVYGPTLNVGAQICLANLTGTDISLFGSFSYGFLKTQWRKTKVGEVNDYTLYHSSELGLSWEVPQEWLPLQRSHLEMKFGYRTQTIYTEASMGDAVDNTEGFTLGFRVTY